MKLSLFSIVYSTDPLLETLDCELDGVARSLDSRHRHLLVIRVQLHPAHLVTGTD